MHLVFRLGLSFCVLPFSQLCEHHEKVRGSSCSKGQLLSTLKDWFTGVLSSVYFGLETYGSVGFPVNLEMVIN